MIFDNLNIALFEEFAKNRTLFSHTVAVVNLHFVCLHVQGQRVKGF